MKKHAILFMMLVLGFTVPCLQVSAMAKIPKFWKENPKGLGEESKEEKKPAASDMNVEYDEISAIKMKRYDELMLEITKLRDSIEGLLAKEEKLSGEKEKAGIDLAERAMAAEIADKNVKKAILDASAEDEKMKNFAAAVAKESAARREKIEKLKTDLRETDDKMKELESSKARIEAENAARDTEYKDISRRLVALKGKSSAGEKNEAVGGDEPARLKKLMGELELKAQDGERLRQQLAEEILPFAEKTRAVEEEISALEREEVLRTKELREKIGDFDKARNGDKQKDQAIEGAKKIAQEAGLKVLSAKAALQKIEEDLLKVSGEKLQAEKDLVEKTEELKVRVSVLVAQNESDQELLPTPKDVDPSGKDMKKRLKRAEKEVFEFRRKTEQALRVNKDLKAKFDKEMLEKNFNLAVTYEMNGFYKDAEKEYLECLKINPEDADVHYNLAILYDDRLNDNKKAQKHYYKFLAFRPIGESGERVRDWIMRSELEKRLGSTVR